MVKPAKSEVRQSLMSKIMISRTPTTYVRSCAGEEDVEPLQPAPIHLLDLVPTTCDSATPTRITTGSYTRKRCAAVSACLHIRKI